MRKQVRRTRSHYGRREKSAKLCPGCGQSLPLDPQTLCEDCATELEEARRLKPQLVTLKKRTSCTFMVGERAFIPSAIKYVSRDRVSEDEEESGDVVAVRWAESMTAFLAAIGGHEKIEVEERSRSRNLFHDGSGGPWRYLNYRRDSWAGACYAVVLPEGAADAIHELYRATNEVIQQARLDGIEEGRNLLAQLAAGTVTVERFEEHAEEIARSRQRLEEVAEAHIEQRQKKRGRR